MTNPPSIPPPGSKRPSLVHELDEALGEAEPNDVPTVFVVGLSGRLAGKLFKIRAGESIIGRSSQAFISFEEKAVSHKHAKLYLSHEGCTIEDLESTNGTFLNDTRLTEAQLLHAGDVIRIGNNALGFLTDAEDEQQHTRAMARLTAPRLTAPVISRPSASLTPAETVIPGDYSIHPQSLAPFPQPQAQEESGNALDSALDKLEAIWGFMRTYRKALIIGTTVGAVLGITAGALGKPMSVAEFEIYLRQDFIPDPARQQQQRSGDLAIQGGEFFAFAERKFTEPNLVQQTLKDLDKPSNKGAAETAAARLSFSPVDRRGTYRGSFLDLSAPYAEKFLATHLQNFLEVEINKSLTVLASEVSLMRREYEKNAQELARVEKELQEFKEKHIKALPENALGQIQSRGMLLTQRDTLAADVSRYSAELNLAKQRLASEDAIVSTKVAQSEPYQAALAEVKQQIVSAQAKGYTNSHPELVRLLAEERRLEGLKRAALTSETTDIDRKSNLEHQRLKDKVGEFTVLLTAAQQELQQVQGRLGEIESLSGKLPEVEAEMTRLLRTQAAAKSIDERLTFELKQKELQLQFERASVAARYEIMQAPHATTPPRQKTMIKFGGVGLIGGLGLGVAWGLLQMVLNYARQRKTKVHTTTAIIRT